MVSVRGRCASRGVIPATAKRIFFFSAGQRRLAYVLHWWHQFAAAMFVGYCTNDSYLFWNHPAAPGDVFGLNWGHFDSFSALRIMLSSSRGLNSLWMGWKVSLTMMYSWTINSTFCKDILCRFVNYFWLLKLQFWEPSFKNKEFYVLHLWRNFLNEGQQNIQFSILPNDSNSQEPILRHYC